MGDGDNDQDSDVEFYIDDNVDIINYISHQSLHCSFGCLSEREMTRTFEQEEARKGPG